MATYSDHEQRMLDQESGEVMDRAMAKRRDFDLKDHGSIALLTPLTRAAQDWVDANLPQDRMVWGQYSIVIEPRFVPSILEGIAEEGLKL